MAESVLLVSPRVVEFADATPGRRLSAVVTARNTGDRSRRVRVCAPRSGAFKLHGVPLQEQHLAPGLSIAATVEFYMEQKGSVRDRLLLLVDGDSIEVPLIGFSPACSLDVQKEVDFGCVLANGAMLQQNITVVNHGSAPGEFHFSCEGEVMFSFRPSSGMVPPKSMQPVQVEFCASSPGDVLQTALVRLDGREEAQEVQLRAEVVQPRLEVLSPSGDEQLRCLKLGAAYYNTSRQGQAILRNPGPEPLSWVAVLQEDTAGEEKSVNVLDASAPRHELQGVLRCFPSQGTLPPHEEIPLTLTFSPRHTRDRTGWNHMDRPPPGHNYALFIHFEIVGSQNSSVIPPGQPRQPRGTGLVGVELAVTATAQPLLLSTVPSPLVFDLGACAPGARVEMLCTLRNESTVLPLHYRIPRVAHIQAIPAEGKIPPGQTQDVVLSFRPKQVGELRMRPTLELLGPVLPRSGGGTVGLSLKPFHRIPMQMSGQGIPVTRRPNPTFNPGLTPLISNATGMLVEVRAAEASSYTASAQTALLSSAKTRIHQHMRSRSADDGVALLSFPNDRAASVRPSDRKQPYRTIFTGEGRHTYIDPDFAYTDEEEQQRQEHKERYSHFIQQLRNQRLSKLQTRENNGNENSADLGMEPASGLSPPSPKPPARNVIAHGRRVTKPGQRHSRVLTTRDLTATEVKASLRPHVEGLNAVPATLQEKDDCSMILSPQQLLKVIIGPMPLDFGEVCVGSAVSRRLHVVNGLEHHVLVCLSTECPELQQGSPLSQVVPPLSRASLPLLFQPSQLGRFQRSFWYSVNEHHSSHLVVLAEVVPLELELRPAVLKVAAVEGLASELGVRSSVRLCNPRNLRASFSWEPVPSELGVPFSLRPAAGCVEENSELECEVVWHPSCRATDQAEFVVNVQHGNSLRLKCLAQIGAVSVQCVDQRVVLGSVPLNITTVRSVFLRNTGQQHAYFQVLDPSPLPGLSILPEEGVVAVGGETELAVCLTPGTIVTFDTKVQVAFRGGKTQELRITGSVEPPALEMNVKALRFDGVYVGSSRSLPFTLRNPTRCCVRSEIDLSAHPDFKLALNRNQRAACLKEDIPGLYSLEVDAGQTVGCSLNFTPTEVAAYDFRLPMHLNGLVAPSPAPSTVPPSPSTQHIRTPRPASCDPITPASKVHAIALRPLLLISESSLEFYLPSNYIGLGVSPESLTIQSVQIQNLSNTSLHWKFDLRTLSEDSFKVFQSEGSLGLKENASITFCFCPRSAGTFHARIPLLVSGEGVRNESEPYRVISLRGVLPTPTLAFNPDSITLGPAPLDTEVAAEFCIVSRHNTSWVTLEVDLPDVEGELGEKLTPFSISFPSGRKLGPSEYGQPSSPLPCRLAFQCHKPLSLSTTIVFHDSLGRRFELPVTVCADNCLLTLYPFLALHRNNHHVVLEEVEGGERAAMLRSCVSAQQDSNVSSSSSHFSCPTSTIYNSLTDLTSVSVANSEGQEPAAPPFAESQCIDDISFYRRAQAAVTRWFSRFGWPGGTNHLSGPQQLRSAIGKILVSSSERKRGGVGGGSKGLADAPPPGTGPRSTYGSPRPRSRQQSSLPPSAPARGAAPATPWVLRKGGRTLYDMLAHLCGRALPGVPVSQSVPGDVADRAVQLHWQHATLLEFLRGQGACLPNVKPEHLLHMDDYNCWHSLLKENGKCGIENEETECVTTATELAESDFENVSERAWTDILLQIFKVFVLSRVTTEAVSKALPTENRTMARPPLLAVAPLSSNFYSSSERLLLSWLNHHYHASRMLICSPDDPPSARWVVNFDYDLMDGLVLAAVLASYCPYLIPSHLSRLQPHPCSPEQYLHNALVLVSALHVTGLALDIQAIEITDPNPVQMLIVCVELFRALPHYSPHRSVNFPAALHAPVTRQIRVSNPSSKPLQYRAVIIGEDASQFRFPKGENYILPAKGGLDVPVEFRGRFLHDAAAVLLMLPRAGAGVDMLAFTLNARLATLAPEGVSKCAGPCYHQQTMTLSLTNPFTEPGRFRVVVLESSSPLQPSQLSQLSSPCHQKETRGERLRMSKSEESHGVGLQSRGTPTRGRNYVCSSLDSPEWSSAMTLPWFLCPVEFVQLDVGETASLEVTFLPFGLGPRHCYLLLLNAQIGDVVYMIEGCSSLPTALPPMVQHDTPNVRVGSTQAGQGSSPVLYVRCAESQEVTVALRVPWVNTQRDEALALAARLRMSELELERRTLTKSLRSAGVKAAFARLALQTDNSEKPFAGSGSQSKTFHVEASLSQHFTVPHQLCMPAPPSGKEDCDTVALPVRFSPPSPGRYPCSVVLRSSDDVRVYRLEGLLAPEASHTTLTFCTAAHNALSQDIPIHNPTQQDWLLTAHVEGKGFYGSQYLQVLAGQTAPYSLLFRPGHEGETVGRLVLYNEQDSSEHTFVLNGKGERPSPLAHVVIHAQAGQTACREISVPNYTPHRLRYSVESDVPFVSGAPTLNVPAGESRPYLLTITPWKRGTFYGLVNFHAKEKAAKQLETTEQAAADQRQLFAEAEQELDVADGLVSRVWFTLEIKSAPPPPQRTVTVDAAMQGAVEVSVPVRNPCDTLLTLDVALEGVGLSGDARIVLAPLESRVYRLLYQPSRIGASRGSVIFQSEVCGEFWFDLELIANPSDPVTLPELQCQLGKWTSQLLRLTNTTSENLELEPVVSNPKNFTLQIPANRLVDLPAKSEREISLQFRPSALGSADHHAAITFTSSQTGAWVFFASGVGLPPEPSEPVSVMALLGSQATLILPFSNPTEFAVTAQISLTDEESVVQLTSSSVLTQSIKAESPFSLLLKRTSDVSVPPRGLLSIPLSFSPESTRLRRALCVVSLSQESGGTWQTNGLDLPASNLTSVHIEDGGDAVTEIRWVFPIHGIPVINSPTSAPATFRCAARSRLEESIEVVLSSVLPESRDSTPYTPRHSARSPPPPPPQQQQELQPQLLQPPTCESPRSRSPRQGSASSASRQTELRHWLDFGFGSEDATPESSGQGALESAVAVSLLGHDRDPHSGIVRLTFRVVFAPQAPLSAAASLLVSGPSGGIYRFPLRFEATEALPDDVVTIHAHGLHQASTVVFRLTSKSRHAAAFSASFTRDSDPEFSVWPPSGELPPEGSEGSPIAVSFCPRSYGKPHRATLLVKAGETTWMYEIHGLPSVYFPPSAHSSLHSIFSGKSKSRARPAALASLKQPSHRNFVSENLNLQSTGPSSPIKGAPLLASNK
ncbi:cilia- and flagella-associated protein 47 isoform X1 [Petromyzon marinus]|uniref:cilia- and flagella-associated protein 47 isoform X1 n=1 Tax=Petromyzon marinus TaxID=7757 RepID=UPI003F6E5064